MVSQFVVINQNILFIYLNICTYSCGTSNEIDLRLQYYRLEK